MPPSDTRPEQRLGAFLRARREGLTPAAAGLAAGARRRTPGLRREEVADLAGISAVWYMRLEQGRAQASPSAATLARLAEALRLGRAERAHLFDLARRRDPAAPAAAENVTVPPSLAGLVRRLPDPAYLLDAHWGIAACNAAAAELFGPWLREEGANLLRFVFLREEARALIVDWPGRARRLVAEFRADHGRAPDDPVAAALVAELMAGSAEFATWWREHHVLGREGGLRLFDHPAQGRLAFEQTTLLPAEEPGFKLVLLAEAVA